jgi:hypothetical protein
MLHGPELGSLRVSLATPASLARMCGSPDALACYSENRIVLPAELRAGSPPLGYLLAHEYAHHILAHRRNDPWPADSWGTKRWATSLGVCPATRRRDLFQGYASMPCEAFAESFAMLEFPMLHLPWSYTDLLAPDDATRTAIRADVLHPWPGPTTRRYAGRLETRSRTHRLSFPLDGSARLVASGAVKLRLELFAGSKLVARARPGRSGTTLTLTICGTRRLTARLTAVRGSGAYTLAVSRP